MTRRPGRTEDAARAALLERLASRIAALAPDRPIVAVDGVDGAGKTMLADELAVAVRRLGRPVLRASVDGFHHPRTIRYRRGRSSPEGFFLDSYDYAALHEALLAPFRAGAATVETARFDHRSDREVAAAPARPEPRAVLLLDGIFLHRDELAGCWDMSVFLDVPFSVSYARMAARDGSPPDPEAPQNHRYLEGQRIYLRTCAPQRRATVLVDYADLTAPRIRRDQPA